MSWVGSAASQQFPFRTCRVRTTQDLVNPACGRRWKKSNSLWCKVTAIWHQRQQPAWLLCNSCKRRLCKLWRNMFPVCKYHLCCTLSARADSSSLTCLTVPEGCQFFGFSPFTLRSEAVHCCRSCQGEPALHCCAAHQGCALQYS